MRQSLLPSPARRVAALVAGGALLAGALLAASPAVAHDRLLSSDPADGADLAAPPQQVTLTYSNEVVPDFVEAAVAAPGGSLVPLPADDLDVSGSDVVLDVATTAAGAQAGEWTVVVRIVSTDGHPVESTFAFEAGAGPASVASAPDVSRAAPAPRVGETRTPAPDEAVAAQDPVQQTGQDEQGLLGGSSLALAAGVLALVVVLAAGLVALARRR